MQEPKQTSNGRHHRHGLMIMKQVIKLLALCIVLLGVIRAVSFSHAEGLMYIRRLGLVDHAPQSYILTGSKPISRRLMRQDDVKAVDLGVDALTLKMVHRNAMDSPAQKRFGSREEEIQELITMDEVRVRGLYAPRTTDVGANDLKADTTRPGHASPAHILLEYSGSDLHASPSPAPADPSNFEELQGNVVSGASFPGNIGQYFVRFSIGTPPQPFLFIVDTGSDLLWVPCSLCADCVTSSATLNQTSIFYPKDSSTFIPIACSAQECELIPPARNTNTSCSAAESAEQSCTYGYGYSDTSQSTGVFGYDTITMSSNSSKNVEINRVAFGCGLNNTGPSITKLGGVIGLGQGPISFTSQVGYTYGNIFSYCFTSFFDKEASSTIVFGDDLEGTVLKAPTQYTPFLENALSGTFYYIGIKGVEIGGEALAIYPPDVWSIKEDGSGGAVIDSGTTLSYFAEAAYDAIVLAIYQAMPYPRAPATAGLPICYNVSGDTQPQLPQLSIIFGGGAVFEPPTENYFLSPKDGLRCLGFLKSSASGLTILGNLLQQNYHVEYDRLHNRLGFAKAQCSLS